MHPWPSLISRLMAYRREYDESRTVDQEGRSGMPPWARNFVLIAGMLVWIAIVGVSLWLKQIPGAVLMGFPAGLWVVLVQRRRITKDEAGQDTEPAASERKDTAS